VIPYLIGFSVILVVLVVLLVLVLRYEIQHRSTPGAHRLLWFWEKLQWFGARLHLTEYSTRTLVLSVLMSALMNVLAILLIYLCSELNNSHLSLTEVAAVSPLGLLTNAVPLSPGGLGVGEKSFDVLYRAIGGENGAGSFLSSRLFLYSPAVLGGLFAAYFLLTLRRAPVSQP
jgi:uncharacterized membrane protein YbhN (UPF0104 family)